MRQLLSPLLAFLLLCSCHRPILVVQTDYVTHKDLASFYVGTPDPRNNYPMIGQRLIVTWMLPREYLNIENLYLETTIRFRNREEITELFDICSASGTYMYTLMNQDFVNTRGILTYKIDLIGNGCVLKEWKHLLWSDLIVLPNETELPQLEEEAFDINWDE